MHATGQCMLSVIPVRSAPKSQAEIVTQLLYGETYTVTKEGVDWIKIMTDFDQYEGYISSNQFYEIAFKPTSFITSKLFVEIDHQVIPMGSAVGAEIPSQRILGILPTARLFLNAPYLWGGRTFMGIDCSGFVQIVHKVNGINLPRDASQQVKLGDTINFKDRQPGDLVFFESDSGNIHHVGIVCDNKEIIHASGSVRIDLLDSSGIIHKTNGKQTHRLHSIKRLR